ncbi:hypothetical protein SO694_00012419 [Aureococcus anophagefferens]|uniref:U-box domain-containing protein n=1 Tax=Aureococcus anophagefferens TaxID=44056 RepID=A0ABR1G1P5_AURAN
MSPAKKKAKTSHESFSSKVLGKLTCPITSELCVRPVIAEDGRVYERASIRRWLSSKSTSPMTNEKMGTRLVDCATTRSLILEAIDDGIVENESAAAAWHLESAKAKSEGKLPGALSSVKDHLERADKLESSAESKLLLRAVELRLQAEAIEKDAAAAGLTNSLASILNYGPWSSKAKLSGDGDIPPESDSDDSSDSDDGSSDSDGFRRGPAEGIRSDSDDDSDDSDDSEDAYEGAQQIFQAIEDWSGVSVDEQAQIMAAIQESQRATEDNSSCDDSSSDSDNDEVEVDEASSDDDDDDDDDDA